MAAIKKAATMHRYEDGAFVRVEVPAHECFREYAVLPWSEYEQLLTRLEAAIHGVPAQAEIDRLKAELEKAKLCNDSLEHLNHMQELQNIGLEKERDNLIAERDVMHKDKWALFCGSCAKVNELNQELAALKEGRQQHYQDDIIHPCENCQHLQAELERQKELYARMSTDSERIGNLYEKLSCDHLTLQDELERVKAERDGTKELLRIERALGKDAEVDILRLTKERDALRDEFDRMKAAALTHSMDADLTVRLAIVEQERDALRAEVERLTKLIKDRVERDTWND